MGINPQSKQKPNYIQFQQTIPASSLTLFYTPISELKRGQWAHTEAASDMSLPLTQAETTGLDLLHLHLVFSFFI